MAVAILGTGSAVPATIRRNDDPIFDWIRNNLPNGHDLFRGYQHRRVLGPDENLFDLMAKAGSNALTAAGLTGGNIDLVVGYASYGRWAMPNDLVAMARELDVPPTAIIMPINSEYANFEHGLLVAEGLIAARRATNALVVVGADWTRYVTYEGPLSPPAISAGDGAGAAVVGPATSPKQWRILDVAVSAEWQYLGGMYQAADPSQPPSDPPTFGPMFFHLEELGYAGFKAFGITVPPALVQEVLTRNGLTPAQIAFVCHQTSMVLLDAWRQALEPGQFVQTLTEYANMTSASIPVNLDQVLITKDRAVLVGLGPEQSCTVVLLGRSSGE